MVEPKRLITVSIGKMQACRGQRGGPSLHKSLMVSAVLHKARNIIMMDVMMQARKAQMIEQHQQMMILEHQISQDQHDITEIVEPPRPGTPLPSVERIQDAIDAANVPSTCDKENNPPMSEVESQQTVSNSEESTHMDYKENLDSSKCGKRRLAESTTDCENVPPKRAKCDNDYSSESSPHNEVSSTQDCSQQISNLVQRFNNGLNGLLSVQKGSSSPLQDSQGLNDVISSCCATQLSKDSGFTEQISRPVIALTV